MKRSVAFRRIAAERQHVVDPRVTQAVEDALQVVDGRVDAGQVRHRLDVELTADPRHELDRSGSHRAPCAVRHRDECRLQLAQMRDRLEELAHAVVGLRREELEGEDRLAATFKDGVETHGEHHATVRQMLAAYASAVGGDDPLANLAVGEPAHTRRPGPDGRSCRVRAASLNHHDLWTLRGVSSTPVIPPQILGCDAAGEVDGYGGDPPEGAPAIGARVVVYPITTCGHCAACLSDDPLACRSFRMLSEPPLSGALAEYVEIPSENLIPIPDQVSFADAACLPTAYLTAYRALFTRAGLHPGMSVLVQGASGGVATACILLARLAGITVFATSRDEAKRALAVDLGAEAAFPLERETTRAVDRSHRRRRRGRGGRHRRRADLGPQPQSRQTGRGRGRPRCHRRRRTRPRS